MSGKSPYEAAMARRNKIDAEGGLAELEAAFSAATGNVFLELFAGSGGGAQAWPAWPWTLATIRA